MVYSAVKDWEASEPLLKSAEAEKLFLRELYSYMKKRDSPIERIPNLGFKQSNDTCFTRLVATFKYFRRRSATALVIPASNCFNNIKSLPDEGLKMYLKCSSACS